jgi:hypothetical protein
VPKTVEEQVAPEQPKTSQTSLSQILKEVRGGGHSIEAYAQPLPGGIKFYATYDKKEMASKTISLALGPFGGIMGKKEVEFKVIEDGTEVDYKARFSIGMAGAPGAEIFRNGKKIS